jgi:GT2 family glycosyltransferase
MRKSVTKKILAVVLNFNSENDLFNCVKDLLLQKDISLTIAIIDNASNHDSIESIKKWSSKTLPNIWIGATDEINLLSSHINNFKHYLILNNQNNGYSAGNNIGTKFAEKLDIESILIANPDMRFADDNYLIKLYDTLFEKEKYVIAGSRILGLNGKDQSPMRESTFMEEFLWVKQLFPNLFKTKSFLLPFDLNNNIEVPKIMGCCFLIKNEFIYNINYFDENVFLYSEEAILSSQILNNNKKIIFTPNLTALHCHKSINKEKKSLSMLHFIKSRKYYLKNYSGYNIIQLILLNFSYSLLYLIHLIKSKK